MPHRTVPRGIAHVFIACLTTGLTGGGACSTLGATAAIPKDVLDTGAATALFAAAIAWAAYSVWRACRLHAQDVQPPRPPRSRP